MILEIIWVILILLHIFPFLAYIFYMKHLTENKPWNIKFDLNYEPTVSILVPTYNEAKVIEKKLNNIFETNYPKDKVEMIIVDSASTDNTVEKTKEFMRMHQDLKIKLLKENERKGMVKALNLGFRNANGELILKTDADCLSDSDSLKNAMKYIADPQVGSVAGLHKITAYKNTIAVKVEKNYRSFYRWLRIGESKLHSTVLYEGEFMLVKKKLLEKLGGFDEEMGADDVPLALMVAKQGYRAITAEDVNFIELTPYTWKEKFNQKVRRGTHVLQTLWKYKNLISIRGRQLQKFILPMEIYIYIINPLIAILIIVLIPIIIIRYPWLLLICLLLLIRELRYLVLTHLTNIAIMFLVMINRIKVGHNIKWEKIDEIR